MSTEGFHPQSALVARADPAVGLAERYLRFGPEGHAAWIEDPDSATPFTSLREATRAAMRLPAEMRAFGVPASGVTARPFPAPGRL
jgi:hypothetical protein